MGNEIKVTTRTFTVKEGMTPEDVQKSNNATAQQKKMAHVFDSDGVKGYSKREAAVFNATTISDHGKNGVSLWTKHADGSRKETAVKGDLKAFKYAPEGDITSYRYKEGQPTTKKVTQKKPDVKRGSLTVPADYKNPYIEEKGVKADTTSTYLSNKQPANIYYTRGETLLRGEDFDAEGKLESYTDYYYKNKDGYYEFDEYNSEGKRTVATRLEGEHSRRMIFEDSRPGHIKEVLENTKTEKRVYERYNENELGETAEYYYHADGTDAKDVYHMFKMKKDDIRSGDRIVEYNQQGKKIKETTSGWYNIGNDGKTTVTKYNGDTKTQIDVLDNDDVLKYSVFPKYNKDGILIKNDTIWNQKK